MATVTAPRSRSRKSAPRSQASKPFFVRHRRMNSGELLPTCLYTSREDLTKYADMTGQPEKVTRAAFVPLADPARFIVFDCEISNEPESLVDAPLTDMSDEGWTLPGEFVTREEALEIQAESNCNFQPGRRARWAVILELGEPVTKEYLAADVPGRFGVLRRTSEVPCRLVEPTAEELAEYPRIRRCGKGGER